MRYRDLVMGTTAMLGALVAGVGAQAATVSPGGSLDLTLTGFARFLAHGGDLDNARLDRTVGGGLDFSNDTEVHVLARLPVPAESSRHQTVQRPLCSPAAISPHAKTRCLPSTN